MTNDDRVFRLMVEHTLDVLTILDQDGIIRYESPSVERLLGWRPEELIGRSAFDFLHPDDLAAVMSLFAEGIQEAGYAAVAELRFLHKDGSWRVLESQAKNMLDDPVVEGVIVNSRDVTERKQAVEALRRSEQRHRALLDALPDAMVRIARDGTYLDLRLPASYEAIADPAELIGASAYDVLPPEIALRAMESVTKALDTGEPQRFEYEIEVGGQRRIREARVVVSGPDEVLSVQRDVTERKRHEVALEASRHQLRELAQHLQSIREEERTRISREVHDVLGQALTALRMDVAWMEKHREEHQAMGRRLEAMKTLIDETVRTVRRIAADLRPGVLDDLGLAAALEWQAQEFEQRTGIHCRFASETDDYGLDRERSTALFRIFQEILTNVARHAAASHVEIELGVEHGGLVLRVADDGRGIRDEEIENTQSLGLLGMRERALAWSGRVHLDGRPGGGTVVTVVLPLETGTLVETSGEGSDDQGTDRG